MTCSTCQTAHATGCPEDELLIEYRFGESTLLRVDDESSGLADLPPFLGYQLTASDQSAVATWLTIKVPTGKAADLTGSGAVDIALSLAGERQVSERWQLFGQASVVWLGEGDVLADLQQDFAGSLLGHHVESLAAPRTHRATGSEHGGAGYRHGSRWRRGRAHARRALLDGHRLGD